MPRESTSPGAARAQIALEGVGKRYETTSGALQAVDSVDLAVATREFVTLLGPSGCRASAASS